ncbi:hypothetical protein LA080_002220 [Diaporthe eres]|nr:hypothetical protein LA080_002220 [Diaporthe eres]
MNLTRLNSNSGLYEHTHSPTKADLTDQDASGSLDTTAHRCFTHSRRSGHGDPAGKQSSLPSDHHHHQRRRLSLVDFTIASRPIQPRRIIVLPACLLLQVICPEMTETDTVDIWKPTHQLPKREIGIERFFKGKSDGTCLRGPTALGSIDSD